MGPGLLLLFWELHLFGGLDGEWRRIDLPIHVCRRDDDKDAQGQDNLLDNLREGVQDPEFIQLMRRVGGSLGQPQPKVSSDLGNSSWWHSR
jgi:hypothetical protein